VAEQLELAEAATEIADRRRHATFVVAGAGYAGTEVTAELHAATIAALRFHPRVRETGIRWLLVQRSDRVLPQLGQRLGEHALRLLRRRGVDVRLDTTIEAAGPGWVRLSRGEVVPTETLVWTAGVLPSPWASRLGLPVDRHGRIIVDESLCVPGFSGVYALGDAARVPQHGERDGYAPPTATHATRQAMVCAENIAGSFGNGGVRVHRHHDRSLFVNLGRRHGVASLAGVPLHGLLGWAATVTHRVTTLPAGSRRRVAFDWVARSNSVADLNVPTQVVPQLISLPGIDVSGPVVGPDDVALAAP
jgi:NADH dehydrogenase